MTHVIGKYLHVSPVAQKVERSITVTVSEYYEIFTKAKQYEERIAGLTAERDELAAVIDSAEIRNGLTDNGSMWRFWAKKAREALDARDAARAEGYQTGLKLVEAAFYEGFAEGRKDGWDESDYIDAWKKSDAFAVLKGGDT
jgi:hypothetical protein